MSWFDNEIGLLILDLRPLRIEILYIFEDKESHSQSRVKTVHSSVLPATGILLKMEVGTGDQVLLVSLLLKAEEVCSGRQIS